MSSTYKAGDNLTVKIERIVPRGYGIGFAEGLTVFVALAAEGDVVRVRLTDGTVAGYEPHPLSCWEAKDYLKAHFDHVWKVECNGKYYTFKVKNWGPVKTVKINKWSGDYWFV